MSIGAIVSRILALCGLYLLFEICVFVIVFLGVFFLGEPHNSVRYAGYAVVSAICWGPPLIVMVTTIVLVSCSKRETKPPKRPAIDTLRKNHE